MTGHSGVVWSVAVTPDDRQALSASSDRTLRLWDLANGKQIRELLGHEGWVWDVVITPDGRYAISAAFDRTVRMWDITKGSCIATLYLDNSPTALAVSDENSTILVGDRAGNVYCLQAILP